MINGTGVATYANGLVYEGEFLDGHKVLANGNSILLFPSGKVRRQPEEIVAPYLSGVHEILNAKPDIPVMLLRLGGLGKFQTTTHDLFWSFLGRTKGRRHISLDLTQITLDASQDLEAFNAQIETLLNTDITPPVLTPPAG